MPRVIDDEERQRKPVRRPTNTELCAALGRLADAGDHFADPDGSSQAKLLWADIAWARKLLQRV